MSKELKEIFTNDELGLNVRTIKTEDGSIGINAEDVAIGFGWTQTETKGSKTYTSVKWARVNGFISDLGFDHLCTKDSYIPESLFYLLGMKANNGTAKKFQLWLATEVIPDIRKHGAYIPEITLDKMLNDPDFAIGLLTKYKAEKDSNKLLQAEVLTKTLIVKGLVDKLAVVGDLIQPREGEISLNDLAAQLGCYSVNGKPHGDFIFKVLNEIVRIISSDQDCFSHRSGSTVLTDTHKHNVVVKKMMLGSIEDWINNPLNIHSTKGTTTKYKFLKSSNLSNVYTKPKEITVEGVF